MAEGARGIFTDRERIVAKAKTASWTMPASSNTTVLGKKGTQTFFAVFDKNGKATLTMFSGKKVTLAQLLSSIV